MTVFLSGGCKNGKSTLAEQTAVHLSRPGRLYYLATMIPHDEEDRSRIARHVASRSGLGFQTIECGLGLEAALRDADVEGTYLLDSVTALLSNEMFRPDGSFDESAGRRAAEELHLLSRQCANLVCVADNLWSDGIRYDPCTETYRCQLAHICRTLAADFDTVASVTAGIPHLWKGTFPALQEEVFP